MSPAGYASIKGSCVRRTRELPVAGNTQAVDWKGAAVWRPAKSALKYLPAVTYFPTPSPEQYRRR